MTGGKCLGLPHTVYGPADGGYANISGLICRCFSILITRREVTVEKVYIASGYPKESSSAPGELVLAVFVSTGGNKFLSKHVLLTIVQEFRGNLSSALGGKEITGVGRLHLDVVKETDPPGSSGKTKILYIFFGVFLGIVLILAVCIVVTCW